ncbi:hypothetical protein [Halomonas sp. GD1P12]|uniref:hypothetical protein n=1 Tax=Halomonas sp. GD1P12 TaxID=2982691 RepID=UPI0021E364F5|nr:hypothetical protein [Halomonas sp. GD1P12]UYG01189.1 hypothetical protein OCT39_06465 [Halomonas sp. GD1P12]
MIELAMAGISLFGLGDWTCTSDNVYPDGMEEHIESRVTTRKDLTYEETLTLDYRTSSVPGSHSRLQVFITGHKDVVGHTFIAYPEEIELVPRTDELRLFSPEFLEASRAFYLEPSAPIEVVSRDEHAMILRLKESGEETTCQAVSAGA